MEVILVCGHGCIHSFHYSRWLDRVFGYIAKKRPTKKHGPRLIFLSGGGKLEQFPDRSEAMSIKKYLDFKAEKEEISISSFLTVLDDKSLTSRQRIDFLEKKISGERLRKITVFCEISEMGPILDLVKGRFFGVEIEIHSVPLPPKADKIEL